MKNQPRKVSGIFLSETWQICGSITLRLAFLWLLFYTQRVYTVSTTLYFTEYYYRFFSAPLSFHLYLPIIPVALPFLLYTFPVPPPPPSSPFLQMMQWGVSRHSSLQHNQALSVMSFDSQRANQKPSNECWNSNSRWRKSQFLVPSSLEQQYYLLSICTLLLFLSAFYFSIISCVSVCLL